MKNICRFAVATFAAAFIHAAAAQSTWSGLGSTWNWNDTDNWDAGFLPGASSAALFTDFAGAPGHLTNVVSSSLTIPGLAYSSTSNYFVTTVPSDRVLTLGPDTVAGQPLLRVGTFAPADGYTSVAASISGAGTLQATNVEAVLDIHQSSADYGDHRATLDLSGLNHLSASVSNVWVGVHATDEGAVGTLILARTNVITTSANSNAPGILLGSGEGQTSSGALLLGWQNTFHTDSLVVGGSHSGGQPANRLAFGPGIAGGTFQLRGSAGGASRAGQFAIADATARPDGFIGGPEGAAPGYGTRADFTGGSVDARVHLLTVGRSSAAPGDGYGWAYGSLVFDQGTVDASTVVISQQSGTNFTSAYGTITLGGTATLQVEGDLSMALRPSGQSYVPLASLEINDHAHVRIQGNLVDGGGTSTIKLGGGVIDLQPAGDATPGNLSADELLGQGTITNAASIVVLQKLQAGDDFTPATLGLDGDLFLSDGVSLKFNVNSNPAPAGLNDFIRVGGNLTLSNNPLSLVFDGPLTPGTYHLIDYAGSLSGTAQFSNPTRLSVALDQTTLHHLDLLVSGAPGNLVWSGIGGNEWDNASQLWNGDTDSFYTLDHVTFNDAGSARTVAINGDVEPGSITVGGSGNYLFQGFGKITGFTGIIKNGPGTFNLDVGGDYRGTVLVNAGVLKASRYQALGATNGGTYVASGGTLDIAGQFMNDIEPVFIAGSGHAGLGAVMNSGGASLYGLRSLTLTGDALVSATGSSWGVSGAEALQNDVNLAGHTLTKTGTGIFDLYTCAVTDAGNLIVSAGALRIRQCIVSGAGSLDLGANELMFQNSVATGYVAKAISVNGGRISATGEPAWITAPIASTGPLTISNETQLTLSGAINGPGALTKDGTASLLLEGANGFTGPTHIRGGQIVLGSAGTLSGSPLIQVAAGAGLDVSARPAGYGLVSGQALQLDGTLTGDLTATSANPLAASGTFTGSLTTGGGSTMTVGGDGATLTVNVVSNLTLSGAQYTFELTADTQAGNGANDLVAIGGDLNLSALNTLVIRPVGILSGTYTLFTYGGTLAGGAANLTLSTPSRYTLTLVDPATTPGEIRVQVTGSAANLVWQGGAAGAPTLWDLNTTTNWLRSGTPSTFREGDLVSFNDAGATNLVALVGQLRPAAMSFNNVSRAYRLAGSGSLFAANLTNNGTAGVAIANQADNTLTGAGLFLNVGTLTFDQPINATWTGRLSGTAALAKTGTNTLTCVSMGGTNFSGDALIQDGTVRLGSANMFGVGRVTVASGARLDVNGQIADACEVRVTGSGPDGSGAINNFGGAQLNALSQVRLDGDTALGAAAERWDVTPGSGSAFQGLDQKLTKTGPGEVWIRSGSATGIGELDVAQGLLVFGGAGTTLGNPARSIVVRSNASLGFGGEVVAGNKPATLLPGGSLYAVNASNHYAGAVTLSNGLVRLEGLSDLELAGPLHGPAALHLVRASDSGGRLILSGTNTYTGGTEVNVGMLTVANAESLPPGSTVVLTNTGAPYTADMPILDLGTNVVSRTNNTLHMYSSALDGLSSMVISGGGTWQGPVILEGDGQFFFEGGLGGLTFTGPFTAIGAYGSVLCLGYDTEIKLLQPLQFDGLLDMGSLGLGVLATSYTTLTLGSAGNAWTATAIRRGRLNLGADNALPRAPIYAGTLAGNDHRIILDLAGHRQTIVSLEESFLGNDPITIGNSSTSNHAILTYAGDFSRTLTTASIVDTLDAGFLTTALNVTSGTLTLVGTNTYTGPTLVSGGTLQVSIYSSPFGALTYGGQLGYTPVTVTDSGTLGGDGIIGGPVTIEAGGTLAPGASLGKLTMNDTLTLLPGSRCVFEVDLAVGTNDMVAGLANVTYAGTLEIQNLGAGGFGTNTVLKLFDAASYTAGSVVIEPAAPGAGLAWDTSLLATDGTLRVIAAAQAPAFVGASRLPDGNFKLTLTGTVDQPYSIHATTNLALPLASWTLLQSGNLPASPYAFSDLTATNFPQRYYRTSTP